MDAPRAEDLESSIVFALQVRQARGPLPTATVRLHRSEPWTIVEVVGEMDMGLLPLLPTLSTSHARLIMFDLSGVTFMDAAGLGALIGSRTRARRLGGDVRLVAPSLSVCRILALTGESQAFPTFTSFVEAASAPVFADLDQVF